MAESGSALLRSNTIDFCTLGMFILDDIDFGGSKAAVKNVVGGAASFAVVGARMVAGPAHAQSVSWIVDVGADFPPETLACIESWSTDCLIREDRSRLTTRAWNGYHPDEKRDFKYLTPKLRLEPHMLSEKQVWSKTFHMVCSPSRCISIVNDILRRRQALYEAGKATSGEEVPSRPFFVWEPVPDLCTPEEQETFFAANRVVDVVSPNHQELGMMFEQRGWSATSEESMKLVDRILSSGIGPESDGCLVIRAGKDGCYAFSGAQKLWLPAYHQPKQSGATAVVDPTGAGNSFLGGLAQGMVSSGREPLLVIDRVLSVSSTWRETLDAWGARRSMPMALICATVAAGVVVEQIGVPQISTVDDGRKELWNESEFAERIRLYTQRLYESFGQSPQKHLMIN
ncbi:hypothetical protein N7539_002586 [Penicillium diatomitis]|uniref:Carbohydrate kinase PfkB domain-containing protein n=1 Tax=Penicillium diatomitis TaxID=2819901 RepID=A0A9W9XEX9_9EURO|nr:uncharacterized protein N7539_002586 [Penicillium diatomitis]KAJ5491019.1 hypothetical protein N7539_002586 [Penicillium diatomitis]